MKARRLWTPGVIAGALIVGITIAAGGGLVLVALEILAMFLASAIFNGIWRVVSRAREKA